MNKIEIEKGILHISLNDENLKAVIARSEKYSILQRRNHFHALLRAIIGQQLSVKAAAAINRKFMSYFENNPNPEDILNADSKILRSLGLSNAKVKYVKDLSTKILMKEIRLNGFKKKTDAEIIAELTKVKGIGTWTVHMFLIFTLGRLNVLPVNDLGLKRAIKNTYRLRKLPDERKINLISKKNKWMPYNSIACWYLWRSLEISPLGK